MLMLVFKDRKFSDLETVIVMSNVMPSAPKSDAGAGSKSGHIEDIQMKDNNKTKRQDEDVERATPVEESGCSSGTLIVFKLILVILVLIGIWAIVMLASYYKIRKEENSRLNSFSYD